jgi:chaperonin GroEL (HSP60 family)
MLANPPAGIQQRLSDLFPISVPSDSLVMVHQIRFFLQRNAGKSVVGRISKYDDDLGATFGLPRFDRSGLVIAEATNSSDLLQRKGIEHANRLAQEMNAAVGDGSKTAILIFQELIEKGYKALQAGSVLRDLIHDMDASVETTVQTIKGKSRAPSGLDIVSVARTAAGGDVQVGKIIADALAKTGTDGVVSLTDSSDATTAVDIREGTARMNVVS